ncbi:TetR/AcrR family transcriptional regulator [Conexibacter sp. SYSU D00693]|uniref:TetR/AcrR family transcriptional regulator n=1 Tax=Conexibacter sp. SYSU D00693 TaxID=2812560 RepID=UPI00196A301D|nr:TetR/AcrR family transcriptional regulator [Conexibacter sp. SYSU D00693]
MAATPRRRYAPRLPPEERREQLLDATLEIIGESGYGGVSMEAIARTAGVTKPVVYDLFGNLGGLLRALFDREEETALAALTEAIPFSAPEEGRNPDEVLVAAASAFFAAVQARPAAWRLILLPVDGTPDAVRERVEHGRELIRRQVEDLVGWGLEARGGPSDLEPELASHALVALAEQAARMLILEPEHFPAERYTRFVEVLMRSLKRD